MIGRDIKEQEVRRMKRPCREYTAKHFKETKDVVAKILGEVQNKKSIGE